MKQSSYTYASAGVDIDAGNELVNRIKPIVKKTHTPAVLQGLGGFAALYELPTARYQNPVLVSATDGVGTKLTLANTLNRHNTVGVDLVAMCANDLITLGADPLFFLDYYASGHLDVDTAVDVIAGIAQGCAQADMSLVGGETAEMPGMYASKDFDLAGFCVGIVEKSAIIDGSDVTAGDVLIGLASSGPHSNGFSLIRNIIDTQSIDLNQVLDGQPLGQQLLRPTRIYVKTIKALKDQYALHALAHITGGGLLENLPRVMPNTLCAHIHTNSWPIPSLFSWLQQAGQLSDHEMRKTFNCGIGMVLCLAQEHAKACLDTLAELGETAWIMGTVASRHEAEPALVWD